MTGPEPSIIPVTGRPPLATGRRIAIWALLALLLVWQVAVTTLFTHLVRPAGSGAPIHGHAHDAAEFAGIALVAALAAWGIGSVAIVALIFWIGKRGPRASGHRITRAG